MNMISALSKKPDHHLLRIVFRLLILVAGILLFTGWIYPLPDPVMAGASLQVTENLQAGPTPTPVQTSPSSNGRTSPVVGILVLLAPLLFIAWKSRGVKEPKITASCCAPVIDENKRPFQIRED